MNAGFPSPECYCLQKLLFVVKNESAEEEKLGESVRNLRTWGLVEAG